MIIKKHVFSIPIDITKEYVVVAKDREEATRLALDMAKKVNEGYLCCNPSEEKIKIKNTP